MAKGIKTGGRKKGTPNKKTQMLLEIFEAHEFNPAEKLVEVYSFAIDAFKSNAGASSGDGPDMTFKYLEIAQKAASDAMQYVYPRRKAVDVTSGGQALGDTLVDVIKRVMSDGPAKP